jgi:hypothetical protein
METAAVAQEATVASIPFAAVRVITDVVGREGESTFQCSKVPATRRLSAVLAGAFRMLGTGERERSAPGADACLPAPNPSLAARPGMAILFDLPSLDREPATSSAPGDVTAAQAQR